MVVSGSLQHHHIIISSPSYSSFSLNSLHFAIQSFKSIYPKLELCIVSSSISRNIPIEEEGSKEGETLSSSLSSPHQGPDENLTHPLPISTHPSPLVHPYHTIPYLTLSIYVRTYRPYKDLSPDLSIDQSTITQSNCSPLPNSIKSGPVSSVSLPLFWLAGRSTATSTRIVSTVHIVAVAVRYYIVAVPTLNCIISHWSFCTAPIGP